jgi:hypothetical protein
MRVIFEYDLNQFYNPENKKIKRILTLIEAYEYIFVRLSLRISYCVNQFAR